MTSEPDTERLQVEQLKRGLAERRLAELAPEPDEVAQHVRRADKADYLRAKLEERERSEREAEAEAEAERSTDGD